MMTADSTNGTPAAAPTPGPPPQVAVLVLGESGEILGVRDAVREVFGWDPAALIGQNVRVLLKRGLDNEVGRFLHRHREGKNPPGTIELEVRALRKDGWEFPALVTTLTWNRETVAKNGDALLSWTAAFRDLSAAPSPTSASPGSENAATPVEGAPAKQEPQETTSAFEPVVAAPVETSPEPDGHDHNRNGNGNLGLNGEAAKRDGTLEIQRMTPNVALDPAAANNGASAPAEESDWQAQLEAARQAAREAEVALQEETAQRMRLEERLQNLSNSLRLEQAERSKRFEEGLTGLRQERDELNNKLSSEQQVASETSRRAEELQAHLGRNEAEFEQAKAELERQTAERAESESVWRQQLDTACIAKKELEGAWAGAVERNKRTEEELAKLRREHDELNRKLAEERQAATDSKQRSEDVASRLSRNAAAAERARVDLEKENAERQRADDEWRGQLEAAKALKRKLELAVAEATQRSRQFEQDLMATRQERDDLSAALKDAQESAEDAARRADKFQLRAEQNTAEFEKLAADVEKQAAERERLEARAREQEEAARARARKLEADWTASVERNVGFEEELEELRANRDDLTQQLKTEQRATADALERAVELKDRLEQTTAELKRTSTETGKGHSERKRAETEWREQLESAKALTRKLEAAWTTATERSRRLENEAADLRKECEAINTRLAAAQREAAGYRARLENVESRVPRAAATTERKSQETERRPEPKTTRETPKEPARDTAPNKASPPDSTPRPAGSVQAYRFDAPPKNGNGVKRRP